MDQKQAIKMVCVGLESLVAFAKEHGLVVTVTQLPAQPLRMGNTFTAIDVRQDRASYGTIETHKDKT